MNADDTAVIADMERDAKRYRWLRLHPTFLGWDADYRPDEVDKAVDQEITQQAALVERNLLRRLDFPS